MHEEEARLSSLLNLSDKLSSVLDSAKRVVPEADTSDQQRNRSDSTDSTSAAFDMNQLMSIMYRLRMGGKGQRAEIANAASALGQLCRAEKVQQVQIIEAIKQVGGLQLLLSALTSYHDWEDVEMQISKVIAVLVMNEDDWQMLQRLAFEILSALYTLTLKVSARIRSPLKQRALSQRPLTKAVAERRRVAARRTQRRAGRSTGGFRCRGAIRLQGSRGRRRRSSYFSAVR